MPRKALLLILAIVSPLPMACDTISGGISFLAPVNKQAQAYSRCQLVGYSTTRVDLIMDAIQVDRANGWTYQRLADYLETSCEDMCDNQLSWNNCQVQCEDCMFAILDAAFEEPAPEKK